MQPSYLGLYRSLVTSNADPTNSGRIKVQCPQIAGMAEIRAAEPVNPGEPVPNTNTIVWIGFSGGDITKPYYFANSVESPLAGSWVALSLDSGWTTTAGHPVPSYRVLPDGNIQMAGFAMHASFSGVVAVVTALPSVCTPVNQQNLPSMGNEPGNMAITPSGVLETSAFPSASTQIQFNGIYSTTL